MKNLQALADDISTAARRASRLEKALDWLNDGNILRTTEDNSTMVSTATQSSS